MSRLVAYARSLRLLLSLLVPLMLVGQAAAGTPAKGGSADGGARTNHMAQARGQAKAEVEKAQVDYKLGRFEQALEEYSHAYELFPLSALLFNLGQCHRNLKNYERAIFFFEGYLREQTRLDHDQRVLTEDLLAECRAGLERQKTAAAADSARLALPDLRTPPRAYDRTPPAGPTGMASLTIYTPAREDQPTQLTQLTQPTQESSVVHRWWFWATIAVVAAGGAAAYYVTGDSKLVAPSGTAGTLDRRR